MQKGIIADFSIYRSSLEQVFKKIIKSQQNGEKVMTIQGEEELDTNNLGEKASIWVFIKYCISVNFYI